MRIEEKILLEENELKPNKYIANASVFFLAVMLIVALLNELGAFHVNPLRMRICFAIVALCTGLVQVLGRNKRMSRSRKTKYVIMSLMILQTLAVTTVMYQWTELVIALPILLAMQYHNQKLTRLAITGGYIVALAASPLSIWLGLPQLDFYKFLVRSIGYQIDATALDPDYNKWHYMFQAFKYMSIPRFLIVAAYGAVSSYITRLSSANIQSRADATYFSSTDIMTGIFNRFSFEEKVAEYREHRPEQLLCVYADADGLHELNNEKGHAAGDELLRACARQMTKAFGEMTYRLGGDEFLSFVESGSEKAAAVAVEEIGRAMEAKGYHMSLGVCRLEEGDTIDELINKAESRMYAAKHKFYIQSGKDRRKSDRAYEK